MTESIEKERWEQVNDLMVKERWKVDAKWLNSYYKNPFQYPCTLSHYKFAAKMVSKNKEVLEIYADTDMGIPILAQEAKSYTAIERDNSRLDILRVNLNSSKFHFFDEASFQLQPTLKYDSLVLIQPSANQAFDLFFGVLTSHLKTNGKGLLGLDLTKIDRSLISRYKQQMEEAFELVVPFFFKEELCQCGQQFEYADYVFLMGMQKKGEENL